MTTTAPAPLRWRVHWAVCELDADGEIDEHAAMCLRHAIDAAHSAAIEIILVDLRDLTTVNAAGLALFRAHTAGCHAHGMELGLLIGRHTPQIAEAFVLAGLGEQLRYTHEPLLCAHADRVRLLDYAHRMRRGRLARATQRRSPRRPRRAPTST